MNKKDKLLISLVIMLWLMPGSTVMAEGPDTPAATENAAPSAGPDTAAANDVTDEQAEMSGLTGSYLSGQFARLSGDIDGAIHYLRQVHRKDPTNATIASQLQGLLLIEGKIDEATALAQDEKHIQDGSDQLDALLLVLREVKQHHLEKADIRLDTVSTTGSGQLWQPLLSAWLDADKGKLTKPLELKDMGSELARAAPLVNYHLALINNHAGFKDEAANNFKAAIDDPKNPPPRVMQMLLQFYAQNHQPEVLAPIVTAYRDAHPEANSARPVTLIETSQAGIAEVLYTMGGIMLGAGVTNDAIIYMQLALYVSPDFSEAAMALGDAYNDLQSYDRANAVFEKIGPHDPLYSKAQLHIAVNLERMGKLKESLAKLDTMAKQSSSVTEALITKGDLLRIHSHFREAADAYSQALRHMPAPSASDWPVLFARGACYDRLGNWPMAEKDLRQALVLKPEQPDVLNYLGYGLIEHGKGIAEARALIEKAVKARPDDAQIVDSMGWALYKLGNYEGATGYLEKAVELLPGDPTVNDHLGDAYWRLGRKTEARYQWERSLTFSPEAKLAGSLQRKLRQGLPPIAMRNTIPSASAANVTPPVMP